MKERERQRERERERERERVRESRKSSLLFLKSARVLWNYIWNSRPVHYGVAASFVAVMMPQGVEEIKKASHSLSLIRHLFLLCVSQIIKKATRDLWPPEFIGWHNLYQRQRNAFSLLRVEVKRCVVLLSPMRNVWFDFGDSTHINPISLLYFLRQYLNGVTIYATHFMKTAVLWQARVRKSVSSVKAI